MKKLFHYWFALLPLMAWIACRGNADAVAIENKYGIAYNPVRQRIPLALVNASMKFVEDTRGERYIFVNQEEARATHPSYLRKVLTIDTASRLTREADYYINPEEKLYLIFDHDYIADTTYINVQPVSNENFTNSSTTVALHEADSILQSWGMVKGK